MIRKKGGKKDFYVLTSVVYLEYTQCIHNKSDRNRQSFPKIITVPIANEFIKGCHPLVVSDSKTFWATTFLLKWEIFCRLKSCKKKINCPQIMRFWLLRMFLITSKTCYEITFENTQKNGQINHHWTWYENINKFIF